MDKDEYLRHIIQIFYSQYAKQNLILSVYNLKLQIVFFTERLAKISGFKEVDLFSTIDELANKYSGTASVYNVFRDAFARIDVQHLGVSSIYHGFRNGFFHVVLYQIEGIIFEGEICGYTCRSTNLTRYFLNKPINPSSANQKKNIDKEQIELLSKRELQVLFLLMLNLKQSEMAMILNISGGNISKLINNVCIKLSDSSSSRVLLSTLNRHQVIRAISNKIDINFQPIIFQYVDNEYNLEMNI